MLLLLLLRWGSIVMHFPQMVINWFPFWAVNHGFHSMCIALLKCQPKRLCLGFVFHFISFFYGFFSAEFYLKISYSLRCNLSPSCARYARWMLWRRRRQRRYVLLFEIMLSVVVFDSHVSIEMQLVPFFLLQLPSQISLH